MSLFGPDARVIEANGEYYRVGWDEYGWFTIQRVQPDPDTGDYLPSDDPLVSFTPEGVDDLTAAIEEQ